MAHWFEKIALFHFKNFMYHLTYSLRGAWHTVCHAPFKLLVKWQHIVTMELQTGLP